MIRNGQAREEREERRRYFRIDDDVVLSVRRLEKKHFDDELARFEEQRELVCFMNNIELDSEKMLPLKRTLENNYPEIAEYLDFLERRIDTLSRVVFDTDNGASEPTQRVNISAQGIQYYSSHGLTTDDLVELRITLKPSNKHLLIIGTVVWCIEDPNANKSQQYAIAIDFSYIKEADREVLVKHIHSKQINKLSQQNEIYD